MKLLDIKPPLYSRIVWMSPKAKERWEPVVQKLNVAWGNLERLLVLDGYRAACQQPLNVSDYNALLAWALKHDLNVGLVRIVKPWQGFAHRYEGASEDDPTALRVAVITKDPETGYLNVGTYRMMIQGKNTCGLYLSPGKDARLHIQKAWDAGKPIEVAACWGVDPLFMLVGSQSFPKTVSEYEYAGGIKGEPIPVVKGTATDLLVPANAEIVVEGVLNPNSMKAEGPFGEFTGYYGKPEDRCPLVEIKAVHFRNDPVLTNALMADYPSCEQSGFFSIIRSAKIWDDFDKLGVPGIHGVYSHPAAAGGFGMVVVSVEQKYAGHVTQILALASSMPGSAYFTKYIVAVDHDVDPTDTDQVIWAMSTRCSPVDDIDIQRNSWSTPLDPSKNPPEARPYGSRVLINACKDHRYLNSFSVRTTLSKGVYDKVSERWGELGLPGAVPHLNVFEDGAAKGTTYKEEGQKGGPEDKHQMKA